MDRDLKERLFAFAIRCLKFIRILSGSPEQKTIRYQLSKSATSAGANYEEAQAASFRADFTSKIKICLREMRESNYWLRIIKAKELTDQDNTDLIWVLNESTELKNILGSIAKNSKIN